MPMEIILREEVDNLGIPGDVVSVSPGYARNYLLPRNLAVAATESNKKIVAQQRESHLRKEVSRISEADELKKLMATVELTFLQKAGDNDQLFGSVTSQDISVALDKEGYKLDKKHIRLHEPIKMLGEYSVTVRLHREVLIDIPVHVLNEDGSPAGSKQGSELAELEAYDAKRQAAEKAAKGGPVEAEAEAAADEAVAVAESSDAAETETEEEEPKEA